MSDDLVAFLRERLADDERVATAAQPGPWTAYRSGGTGVMGADARGVADRRGFDPHARYETGEDLSVEDAAHIARHDPARVLAEVKAKRRIVELHAHRDGPHECPEWKWRDPDHPEDPWETETGWAAACLTLRLLASVYAEHPSYRSEWAP